ncbi:MAG TPA: glycoside hydrolase family 20 zincin-like fold domain-containing protein [Candidatus Paceibacterota bacterium]|nr:glycoside hydrolase family 20 zincin-like fold domain-containing protein [Verrucomicrobiota bacterium]HSA12789.1 glycoside hydrolase family 20 zincin-like fold domain-containing protein [Candidatus Paceibacterota bacterium]
MKRLLLCLTMIPVATALAGHNALLPRPQQVRYGIGALKLQGLSIRFASPPSAEDRFAAEQLASGLSAIGQTKVGIRKGKSSSRRILLNRTGDGGALPADMESPGPDSREAYTLQVTPRGAEIRARGSAGIFYGVQTLLQMVEGNGAAAALPVAEVKDWPALAYRGVMIDFSEGELIRVSEAERQIDLMARFKINQYYFYSEASIEFEGYDVVNPNGRYTREEVRHVIEYARQRHIDVVPCMELYGHMHNLFRYEKYADLALPRYGGEFDPRNPRMYAVLDDWIEQTARLFPSPWYHVGFDEPWSLGKIGVVPGKDPFKTFMGVLRHISEKAGSHGKRIGFFADIEQGASTLSKHPELLADVPAGVIAYPWIYEVRTNYAPFVEPLANRGVPTVVTPGVWGWNELFPDYHRSFYNLNELTATGRKFGTLGILNTTWTDSRQTIYRLVYPGIAFGGAASWQSERVVTNSFFSEYCAIVYPASVASDVAAALEELSTVEEIFQKVLQGNTWGRFWADPLAPDHLKSLQAGETEVRRARLLAESAQERIQRALRKCSDPTLKSLLVAARQFGYLGMKSLYVLEWAEYFRQLRENPKKELVQLYCGNQMNSTTYGMLTDLREMISELREEYRQAWLDEATPFRLQSALYRWDAEWDYWTAVQKLLVQQVFLGWKEGEPFPALESIRPRVK